MPKYRVLEKSFINDRIVEAGEEIDYEGEASANLELIDVKGKAKSRTASTDASDAGSTGASDADPLV